MEIPIYEFPYDVPGIPIRRNVARIERLIEIPLESRSAVYSCLEYPAGRFLLLSFTRTNEADESHLRTRVTLMQFSHICL